MASIIFKNLPQRIEQDENGKVYQLIGCEEIESLLEDFYILSQGGYTCCELVHDNHGEDTIEEEIYLMPGE